MTANLIDFDDDPPSFATAGDLSASSLDSSGHIHVRESVLRTPTKESGAVSDLLWLMDDHGGEEDGYYGSPNADAIVNVLAKSDAPREPDPPEIIEHAAIININDRGETTPASTSPPEDITLHQQATMIDLPLKDDRTSLSTAENAASTITPLAAERYPLPPSPLSASAGSGDARSTQMPADDNNERSDLHVEEKTGNSTSPRPALDSSAGYTNTARHAMPLTTPALQTDAHTIVTRPTQTKPDSPASTDSPRDPGPATPHAGMPIEGTETRKSDPYERHSLVHVPSFPYPRPAASVAAASGKSASNGTPTALWWANGQVAVPYGHQTGYQYGVEESWGSPVNLRYAPSATTGPNDHIYNYMAAQHPPSFVQLPTSKPITIKSPTTAPVSISSELTAAYPPPDSAASPPVSALLGGHASPTSSAALIHDDHGQRASDSGKTVAEGQAAEPDDSVPISPDGISVKQAKTGGELVGEGKPPLRQGSIESECEGLKLKGSGVEMFIELFNKYMSHFDRLSESTSELKASWKETGFLLVDSLAHVPEINATYAARLKELLLAQRDIKALRESQAHHQAALAASEGSCQSWEKRCTLLAQTCLGLEDEREALQRLLRQSEGRARSDTPALSVVLVLLEGRMFDPACVKKGSEGGAELASALASVVRDHLEETGAAKGDLIINWIGDLHALRQELSQTVQIATAETVDEFLSGISEEDPLYSVMDVRGRFGATNKIAAQMRAFCEVGSKCQVFLVASSDELFRSTIEELASRNLTSRLCAVRGANNVSFKHIPSAGTIGMNDLFIKSTEEWERRAAKVAGFNLTLAGTPVTPSFVRPAEPPTPVSPITTTTVSSPQGSTPKASVVGKQSLQTAIAAGFSVAGVTKRSVSPAPVSPPPEPAPTPPWKETKAPANGGGSLLDRFMASQAEAVSEKVTTAFTSSREGTSIISSRTGGPQTPEGRDLQRRIGARMNVRIDPSVDGSIGGSPPDSDEDQPSVQLPHSHEQVVQRPVKINAVHPSRAAVVAQANRAASRTRSSSIISTDSLFSNAIRQLNDSASQTGLKTNANTMPLGVRKTSSTVTRR